MSKDGFTLGMASVLMLACGGSTSPASGSDPTGGGGSESGGPATIYVDGQIGSSTCSDYSPSSRSCGGGASRAFSTIEGGADAAAAGDVVRVRGGVYRERLIPRTSGTEDRPIVFEGAPGEAPTLSDLDEPAIFVQGLSHIVIQGLTIENVVGWARLEDSHHITLRQNGFSNALASGTTGGVKLVRSVETRILENVLENGNDSIVIQESDRNVIQGNTLAGGRHSLLSLRCGNHNVIRSNSFSNPDQKDLEIYDCEGTSDAPVKLDATKRNLVEGNLIAETRGSSRDYRYNGIQYAGQQGIVRRNVFRDNAGGGINFQYYADESLYNNRNRVYHNTFYNNRCHAIIGAQGDSGAYYDNRVLNNILYRNVDCAGGRDQVSIPSSAQVILSNNAIAEASPGFVDEGGGDLRLAGGSPMIDAAAFLTTAVGAGSGAELPVGDASYFFDGYGIAGEVGDEIQMEGAVETAIVTHVDLEANRLTLDRPLSWTAGQGVALRFAGAAPDLGAFEADAQAQ